MRLKVYTLGNNGFAPAKVADLLSLPGYSRQAWVLVVAVSKETAARMVNDCRFARISRRDPRLTGGMFADQLLAYTKGVPQIFVYPMPTYPGSPVVAVDDAGPRVVGRIADGFRFEPDEGV